MGSMRGIGTPMRRAVVGGGLVALILLTAGCGEPVSTTHGGDHSSSGQTSNGHGEEHTENMVMMSGVKGVYEYEPSEMLVGDEKEWEIVFHNVSDAPHNVVNKEAGIESPLVKAGEVWVLRGNSAMLEDGAMEYICTLHPGMKGRVERK